MLHLLDARHGDSVAQQWRRHYLGMADLQNESLLQAAGDASALTGNCLLECCVENAIIMLLLGCNAWSTYTESAAYA
jgi:hypothetical protein